jgi:putative FmdB family regulatory protein
MPTYEYRCPKGHGFEKFFPQMNNRRRIRCPKCGQLAERLISGGAGLVFKGSGFYITDYKRAGEKPPESEAASDAKSEAKTEAKPDAKPAKPKSRKKEK